MGEVWRARDLVLDRPVAVKLLRYGYGAEGVELARFRAEARHAGSLSHPGIAQIYDYHEADPPIAPYLVMELVDGPSLARLLDAGPVDPARTMALIAQAARALQAAHTAGLVHRDIKPGNLLVSRTGQLKITDFGIAHATGSAPLTRPGALMGTPAYLAPEQVTGGHATPATDLYALGIVAYQCLTGRPPFTGPPVVVALAHQERPLPPLPPSVPRDVAALVADLTSKDPWMRPAGAGVVAQRAEELQTALTAKATRQRGKHNGRRARHSAYAASATMAVAAIAATGVVLTGMHSPIPAHTQSTPPTVSHQPTPRGSSPAQRVVHPRRTPVTVATEPPQGRQSTASPYQPPAANVVATQVPTPARPRTSGMPTPTRSPTRGTPTPTSTPPTSPPSPTSGTSTPTGSPSGGTSTPTGSPSGGTPTPTSTPPTGAPSQTGSPTSDPPTPTASPTSDPTTSATSSASDPSASTNTPTEPPTDTATASPTSQTGSPTNEAPAPSGQRAIRLQGREKREPQRRHA